MRTRFILHSGLRTIGGVICSVEYGNDRVIFEMGSGYNPSTEVYDGIVEARANAWVRDAIRLGKIPAVNGLYRREDLQGYRRLVPAEESDQNTAVFITHLHLDHMSGIGMVAPQIPVYMNENATRIERALEATGEGVPTCEREYRHLDETSPIRVGQIEVRPLLTSRRSYRDFALLVVTPDARIHWTGDFSMHGPDGDLAVRQMEYLKEVGVDVLLCDATSFMDSVLLQMCASTDPRAVVPSAHIPAGMLDTADVEQGLFEILESIRGLCVINFYQREMDEARRYIEWAERVGRTCVFEPDCAYLVHAFHGIRPHVFLPDAKRYTASPRPEWLEELLQSSTVVTRDEIRDNPSAYLLQNSYRHILELLDLPDTDGAYLHAEGIPIGDFDPAYANMKRVIGLTTFEYVTFFNKNYFGHGYPQQVKYFVDQVDPTVLIPCHSFTPERLLPNTGKQLLPVEREPYVWTGDDLVPEGGGRR